LNGIDTPIGTGAKLSATIGAFIQGKAEAIASTAAACADDPQQRHFGVDFNPSYGIIQNIALTEEVLGVSKTLLGTETGLWIQQLPILCYPFGEPGNVTDTTTISGDAPPPTQVPTGIYSGDAASAAVASLTAAETAAVETGEVS
jgi:hypothetical protein